MRQTIRAAATLSVVALLAAACGSTAKSGSSSGSTASSSSGSSASAAGKFKACMVTDTGGIDDRSFNASAWQGVQEAESSKITGTYLQSTSGSDYTPNINTFIAQKCGIIVTVGFLMGRQHADRGQGEPEAEVRHRGQRLPPR